MQGGKRLLKKKSPAVPIACAVLLTAAGVLAAHMISERRRAELEFARFRVSSNYLEEDGASYTVTDWGDGFDILLYNYEKEDVSQTASVDMAYTVTAEHGTVSVKRQNGEAVEAAADGAYTFKKELTNAYHVLHVTPDDDGGPVAVTVQMTSPYEKTMAAEFRLQKYRKPEYTVTDQQDGTVLVTVQTNDYQDTMTITWEPDRLTPDTANAVMVGWTDENPIGHFPAESNTTYELLFFKKTDDPYTERQGADTVITLD